MFDGSRPAREGGWQGGAERDPGFSQRHCEVGSGAVRRSEPDQQRCRSDGPSRPAERGHGGRGRSGQPRLHTRSFGTDASRSGGGSRSEDVRRKAAQVVGAKLR